MYKISLLSLIMSSSIYPMLSPMLQCAKRFPLAVSVMHVADQQSNVLVQQKRSASQKSSLTEFIVEVKQEAKKIDPLFLTQIKYRATKLSEYSSKEEREAEYANKLRYIAAKAVFFSPSDDDMMTAVRSDDSELVKHVLACGGNPHAYDGRASAISKAIWSKNRKTIGLLLEAGAVAYDKNAILSLSSQDRTFLLGFPRQAEAFCSSCRYSEVIKDILEREAGFSFNDLWFSGPLKYDKQAALLKKIMLVTNAGASIDFSFWTGGCDDGQVVCRSRGDGSREMRFCELKGDWTKGQFPELANYFTSVRILKDAQTTVLQKQAAQAVIEGIMKKYGIQKEDVLLAPKVEVGSSRVQEAD